MKRRDLTLAVIYAVTGCAALGALTLGNGTKPAVPYGAPPAIAAATLLLWTLFCWPRSRDRLARPLALAGGLSLITTAVSDPPARPGGSVWRLAEMAVLLVLLVVVARWVPLRQATTAGAVAGAAVAAWTLPLVPEPSLLSLAGAAAFWSLPVLVAAVIGGYPRLVEHRRCCLITETRRSQQLELARDLHDFVAHDISGIVAQAQAARFVAGSDPGQALPALERIERAGLNALSSMDRTVQMLHEANGNDIERPDIPRPDTPRPDTRRPDTRRPGTPRPKTPPLRSQGEAQAQASHPRHTPPPDIEPLPGVDQLPTLIERFTSAGATEARLTMPSDVLGSLSRETSSTAYRMVVEALTNVRRHAPGATRVEVTLTPAPTIADRRTPAIEIQVVNNAATAPTTLAPTATTPTTLTSPAPALSPITPTTAFRIRRKRDGHGGRGLTALRERIHTAGGTLSYGPYEGGWRVQAVLPQTRTLPQEPS
ncbi:sensor histidine kinase [Streptomyces decoyicus]|uniref:sensor histidine kinase n=1 Tax=Streptomyces decoyicus TaxID=249567 RepID=UPI00362E84BF